jgi:hypothetical protein
MNQPEVAGFWLLATGFLFLASEGQIELPLNKSFLVINRIYPFCAM